MTALYLSVLLPTLVLGLHGSAFEAQLASTPHTVADLTLLARSPASSRYPDSLTLAMEHAGRELHIDLEGMKAETDKEHVAGETPRNFMPEEPSAAMLQYLRSNPDEATMAHDYNAPENQPPGSKLAVTEASSEVRESDTLAQINVGLEC